MKRLISFLGLVIILSVQIIGMEMPFKPVPRWPATDFSVMNADQLDNYTGYYSNLTDVETGFIDDRLAQLTKLDEIESWDHQQAMDFVIGLKNPKSVRNAQWEKISQKIGLKKGELKALIKKDPKDAMIQEYQEKHDQQLKDLLRNSVQNLKANKPLSKWEFVRQHLPLIRELGSPDSPPQIRQPLSEHPVIEKLLMPASKIMPLEAASLEIISALHDGQIVATDSRPNMPEINLVPPHQQQPELIQGRQWYGPAALAGGLAISAWALTEALITYKNSTKKSRTLLNFAYETSAAMAGRPGKIYDLIRTNLKP